MNPEGTRELLRRKMQRETTETSPDDLFDCPECGTVYHAPIPDDRAHCGCISGDGCTCGCHNPSTHPELL